MARQYKLARKMKKIALTAAARELGISQPTLSNWESGRKEPSIESLIKMAKFYDVSTDFLLGLSTDHDPRPDWLCPVDAAMLPAIHDTPVYSPGRGWAFVDAIERHIRFPDGTFLPFAHAGELYLLPPALALPGAFEKRPLSRTEAQQLPEAWVEPISEDAHLRRELQGWYHVRQRFVENELGQRFYFDNYNAKWLAFAEDDTL